MTSTEELEKQYTPSLFSRRFPNSDALINYFVELSETKSQESRMTYDCHLNISYGETKREKLDIYGDNLPKDAPLFIFIHGGYWQMLDKNCSSFFVKPFIENSIRVIVVDYELCPKITIEGIIEQMDNCFKWIADYVCSNGIKKISIAGHSAGAHLLSYVVSESFLKQLPIECSVDAHFISGVYYMDELRHLKTANDGNILSLSDQNYHKLSPQYKDFSYLSNFNVKVYIFAGEFESDMFKEHSRKFAEGPMKNFVKNFKILNVDHFDIVEKLISEDYELTKLMIDNLKM